MSSPSTTGRRVRTPALVATLLLALLSLGLLAPSADAAAYRFWGYYQLKGSTWSFSPKGADQVKPADGSVEGWRWAVADEKDARMPRGTVTFEAVCADTPAQAGNKRVAVVLDFGRPADAESGTPPAPAARCAQVPANASGTQVLADVASVRTDKGMVCGIESWPAAGCGGPVGSLAAAAKAKDQPVTIQAAAQPSAEKKSQTSPLLIGGGVLLLLLVIGALLLAVRRNRRVETV